MLSNEAILYYANHPVEFVQDILKADPDPEQKKILRSLVENQMTSVRSGHGIGKSAVEAWSVIWFMCTHPYPKIPCTAPTQHQLFDILWAEISKWKRNNKTLDQDTKQVFENIVEARETYGIAYLEVIRNLDKEVQQIEFIKDTPSVRKSRPMEPYVEIPYFHHGKETKRRKKFRKYKQEICGRTVYFKEFGDPRIMDLRDGRYVPEALR